MAQWNKTIQDYLNQERSLHEVYLRADQYGKIMNDGASSRSAFGELLTVTPTPVFQLDALYGFDNKTERYVNGTGITTTNTLFQAKTGTGAYGYAVIRSKRTVRYRPGQGALARFTAKFDTGRTGYTQRAGFFTQEQALQVGYNTDGKFGIVRANGGKAHIHKFAITTKAAGTENITVTLAGAATTVSIGAGTTTLDNAAGIGTQAFSGWTVDYRDNEVIFLSNSLGPKSGTFSMTSSGSLAATASTIQSGVVQTEHWTYQEDWNEDNLTGIGGTSNPSLVTLNPQKLNVFQINFRWLGAGEMRYAMENPSNGDMIFIHHDHYSNTNDDVHLDNPSMKIGYVAAELSGNTGLGVTIKGASILGAIEGVISPIDYPIAAYHSRTANITANTITHLLTVKNNLIIDGKINSRELIIKQITCGAVSASAAPCLLYLYVNPTYAATPTFTSIGSAAVYSSTDTTITGTPIAVFSVTTGSPTTIDLSDLRIALPPTTKLGMAISCTSLLTRVDAGITFIED